jgi:hypothetical protein
MAMNSRDVDVTPTHRPANNNAQGWGVAAFIVALALGCVFTAHYIHERTFRSPNDPAAPVTTSEHEPHA